ncbi:MAG: TIGR03905 family TSCPD domain-containing protein [Bacilli bacterium]|nr:TIGR03905 family TSCPD domain-containing protein [Bacilli bacterium]
MEYRFKPNGVCSKEMIFNINEDNTIESLEVVGGCPGNLKGIGKLITGMKIDDVIEKLEGVQCGLKSTSCPDQIAKALKEYKNK